MNDNTKIQLLAIDLDGTTLRNDASLSSNVKKALEYAIQQDIFVVPCTGRALGSLSPEVTAIPGITYAVTSNGRQLRIYHWDREFIVIYWIKGHLCLFWIHYLLRI